MLPAELTLPTPTSKTGRVVLCMDFHQWPRELRLMSPLRPRPAFFCPLRARHRENKTMHHSDVGLVLSRLLLAPRPALDLILFFIGNVDSEAKNRDGDDNIESA